MIKNWKPVLDRIRAALMRRGRSRDEADDLIQEAWVKLARYAQRASVREPEAFLMRAALNLSIDEYRHARHRGEEVLVEDVELPDLGPTLETRLLARELLMRVSDSLLSLDPKTRRIFLAHRVHEMSYQEIARSLKLSVGAVEKHIAKATMHLSRDMEGW